MNVKLNGIKNKQPSPPPSTPPPPTEPPPFPRMLLLVVEENAICRWWNWALALFGKGYRQLVDPLECAFALGSLLSPVTVLCGEL